MNTYTTKSTQPLKSKVPDFFIVGAPKCGTTSLYKYLKGHPQIFVPEKKELHFFSAESIKNNAQGPGDKEAISKICTEVEEYTAHFAECPNDRIAGDVSPSYLYYYGVAKSIKDFNSNAKIVIVLRNPAKKAFSQYCHMMRSGQESLSFSESLKVEQKRVSESWNDMWHYIEGSRYSSGVRHYLDIFGENNVKVILFEEMVANTDRILGDLFSFLGVDPSIKLDINTVHNEGAGKSRFGRSSMLLMRNEQFKRVVKSIVPETQLKRLEAFAKKVMFQKKTSISAADYEYVMRELEIDIRELESLLGKPTGWH